MSFKLHIFTHDQDNVQIPSKVSIILIVYNVYLEASEMCVGCHYIFKSTGKNLLPLALGMNAIDVGRPFMLAAIQSRLLFSHPPISHC